MKNKKLLTNQELAIMGMVLALMFSIGKLFEVQNWGGVTFSIIKLNPVEGFIIIPLTLFGVKKAMVVSTAYLLLMAVTGTGWNAPPAGIGFIAMALALNTYIFGYVLGSAITRPFCIKEPLRGVVNLIIASVVVTIVMVLANWIFISPSFATGEFTTVFSRPFGMGAWDWLKYLVRPMPAGTGIIHGNIMKYGLCSIVAIALLSNKKAWAYKTKKSKSLCRVKLKKPL